MFVLKAKEKFARRLAELIGEGDIRPFARKCGVTDTSLRNYLKGAEPRISILEKIAEACNVSVAWLVGEADDPAGTASQEQTEAAAAAADDLASAVAKLATIFQSNDQGFIRAIQANLDAFSAAVERQEANMQLEKRVEELEAKMARIMNMRDQDGKQVANH